MGCFLFLIDFVSRTMLQQKSRGLMFTSENKDISQKKNQTSSRKWKGIGKRTSTSRRSRATEKIKKSKQHQKNLGQHFGHARVVSSYEKHAPGSVIVEGHRLHCHSTVHESFCSRYASFGALFTKTPFSVNVFCLSYARFQFLTRHIHFRRI